LRKRYKKKCLKMLVIIVNDMMTYGLIKKQIEAEII
jgi:hypothetical protein